MRVPSWVYIGAALATIATAGTGMATRNLSGPQRLSHNDATQLRGVQDIPAAQRRAKLQTALDAEAGRAAVPAERREAEAAARSIVKLGFRR